MKTERTDMKDQRSVEIINFADIVVGPNGENVREMNAKLVHQIPLGVLVKVSYEDYGDEHEGMAAEVRVEGRMWVVFQGRDCDAEPLYWLSLRNLEAFTDPANEMHVIYGNPDNGESLICSDSMARGMVFRKVGGFCEEDIEVVWRPGDPNPGPLEPGLRVLGSEKDGHTISIGSLVEVDLERQGDLDMNGAAQAMVRVKGKMWVTDHTWDRADTISGKVKLIGPRYTVSLKRPECFSSRDGELHILIGNPRNPSSQILSDRVSRARFYGVDTGLREGDLSVVWKEG